jgi:hypothetical protein
MASPPQRLGAHNGAALVAAVVDQPVESGTEVAAHRIVGVIVEALIPPERIDVRWHIAAPTTQATERRNVLVSDLESRQ